MLFVTDSISLIKQVPY